MASKTTGIITLTQIVKSVYFSPDNLGAVFFHNERISIATPMGWRNLDEFNYAIAEHKKHFEELLRFCFENNNLKGISLRYISENGKYTITSLNIPTNIARRFVNRNSKPVKVPIAQYLEMSNYGIF